MKILLLSHVPPTSETTAGLVLEKMCKTLKTEMLTVCAVVPEGLLKADRKTDTYKTRIFIQPAEIGKKTVFRSRILGQLASRVRYFLGSRKRQKIKQEIKNIINKEQVTHIWVLMESVTTLCLAYDLEKELKIPILAQCTDMVTWYLREMNVDRYTKRTTVDRYNYLIKNAFSCAVPSLEMGELFNSKFGTRSVLIANSSGFLPVSNVSQHDRKEILIGLAGQIYAQDAWESLIRGLDHCNWKIQDKDVYLVYLGRQNPSLRSDRKMNLIYYGFRTETEVHEILSTCDLLYCPYPFSEANRDVVSYSFPSKLAMYFSTGVPVLGHAPLGSSILNYLQRNESGFICESLDPVLISQKLINVFSDKIKTTDIIKNSSFGYQRDFSERAFQKSVYEFFGTLSL